VALEKQNSTKYIFKTVFNLSSISFIFIYRVLSHDEKIFPKD